MNETKATPGPWEVGESVVTIPSPVGEEFLGVGNFDLGRSVARISRIAAVDGEDESNANLISAAPDLLAACQWIADLVLTARDGGDAWCAVRQQPGAAEWLKTLRAALAKATGDE